MPESSPENVVTIPHTTLTQAAKQSTDTFLQTFVDAYNKTLGGGLNARNMDILNGEQITILAYSIFRQEVMNGGFVQLIHNGYGPFIFDNPFAKAMRLMGAHDFAKLLYKARRLYQKHKTQLTQQCTTDDEFMALFEKFPEFDNLDDKFIEMEEQVTNTLARYIDQNIQTFAQVIK